MKIAVTGSDGLIGSRFCGLLSNQLDIFEINLANGINILDKNLLLKNLAPFSPDVIIHFAAKTHVDLCEKDKEKDSELIDRFGIVQNGKIQYSQIDYLDWKDKDTAFSVNVVGTKNVAEYALTQKTKLVYISTDFVFSGEKDYYSENDIGSPISWYGQTKLWGEQIVSDNLTQFIIVRIAYPYGKTYSFKKDFAAKIIELLATGVNISLVSDHYMTPTFIDDIALGLEFLLRKKANGMFHLVGKSFVTPYEAGMLIADTFSFNKKHIKSVNRAEFFKGRAQRPFQLRLKHDKLINLGFETKTFEEGLLEIKTQMTNY